MNSLVDIGYAWPWTHGHLVIVAAAMFAFWIAWRRRWHRLVKGMFVAVALWAVTAFLVVQFVFRFNEVPTLPTQSFLSSGPARVIDIGAGSGRSSLMVLVERPEITLVAVDNFSAEYIEGHGQHKTEANFRAAGYESRATVQTADMRELPFENASFDAAVSAYAIDHLDRTGIRRTLAETARVLRPSGQFLLEVMYPDGWMRFVWGPLVLHDSDRRSLKTLWTSMLDEAGFEVTEQGTLPITFYMLARKR